MSENTGDNQRRYNSNSDPFRHMRGATGDPYRDLTEAIYDWMEYMDGNPNNFRDARRAPTESQSSFSSNDNKWKFEDRNSSRRNRRRRGSVLDEFEDGIRDQLLDSLAGGDFEKKMNAALAEFTKRFGVSISDLPYEVGKRMSKQAFDGIKNSKMGQQLGKELTQSGSNIVKSFLGNSKDGKAAQDALSKVWDAFKSGESSAVDVGDELSKVAANSTKAAEGAAELAEGGALSGEALAGLTASLSTVAAVLAPIVLLLALAGPALKGTFDLLTGWGKSFTRNEDIRRKRIENADKRLQADINYMVEKPFKILEEAAQKWYDTWDNNLRKIGQTQGYDKGAVYSLYEGYAERLRADGLTSVISATDIVNQLASVLDSGLSGQAAEEFAYAATKLNAAIPNQDFFSYVDTYASIAANAIAQGDTEAEALAKANAELEQFASNLLYSSRELAGGFTTGLKNSSAIFQSAAQIAQSAKTYNTSAISGTLTSVSAIVGSVAPDLADALVQNVVQAAIGGNNNTQLVALRSLAGINAGNTEFLRTMAEDPQSIFSALFTNLANLQNMSPDNYMEVAEGLADVFGIDKAAFARVDFNYLAQAISAMNVNNSSLEENMALLASGQTTTSAEQLKAQEINSIILEEGLAYVIDSEAGRMIQEHMWQEQIANAQMENEYAVNLQGSALSFIEGIREAITNILHFLNPMGFIATGVKSLVATADEMEGNRQDIAEILELGAIGSNSKSFSNLVNVGEDLGLVTSLVEMMGGRKGTYSEYANWLNSGAGEFLDGAAEFSEWTTTIGGGPLMWAAKGYAASQGIWGGSDAETYNSLYGGDMVNQFTAGKYGSASGQHVSQTSRYVWNTVGKSVAQAIQSTPINSTSLIGSVIKDTMSASLNAESKSQKNLQSFIDSAVEASKEMGYDAYLETAKNFGISNIEEALSDFGITAEQLQGYFEANQAREGAIQEQARKEDEQTFRDETREYWDYASGSSGVFQTAMWLPFFGEGAKYDTRMDAVDVAMSDLQVRIGSPDKHTVIGALEEISDKLGDATNNTVIAGIAQLHTDLSTTFISPASAFQRCLADWIRYIAASQEYTKTISRASAWSDLQAATQDQQTEATLALANALNVFSAEELKNLDPQLQANALLGEIIIILQTMMQQNNTVGGSLSLPDSLSALGMGITFNKPA